MPKATPLAGTPANSWTLELRPLRPSLPAGPLPYSPRRLRLPESPRTAGRQGAGRGRREGGSWLPGRRALQFPARCAPTAAGPRRPGHAGAQGGSMKGADRAYTRGPSWGWLLSKCCCCFPCGGEWLWASAPSLSRRPGGLSARERWRHGVEAGRWPRESVRSEPRLFQFPWRNARLALAVSR